MATLTIGQVAARSGFPASTLRFYERRGLITPIGRSDAGYRLYDEAALDRLSFVARAKQLGCTLDEITHLATLWEGADCWPVQRRLHELVTEKIVRAQRQTTEALQFTHQLQVAASHLDADPTDGPCGTDCACLRTGTARAEPVVLGAGPAEQDVVCTLASTAVDDRVQDWQRVLADAGSRTATEDGGLRVALHPDVDLGRLVKLAVAEQRCCSFFAFALTVDSRGVALEVRAPAGADDIVAAVFGMPA